MARGRRRNLTQAWSASKKKRGVTPKKKAVAAPAAPSSSIDPYTAAPLVAQTAGSMLGGETGQALEWGAQGASLGAQIGSVVPGVGTAVGAGIGAGIGAGASLFSKSGDTKQKESLEQLRRWEKAKRERFRSTVEDPAREAYRRSAISALQRQQTGLARRGLGDSPMGVGLAAGMQRQYDVDAESKIAQLKAQMEENIEGVRWDESRKELEYQRGLDKNYSDNIGKLIAEFGPELQKLGTGTENVLQLEDESKLAVKPERDWWEGRQTQQNQWAAPGAKPAPVSAADLGEITAPSVTERSTATGMGERELPVSENLAPQARWVEGRPEIPTEYIDPEFTPRQFKEPEDYQADILSEIIPREGPEPILTQAINLVYGEQPEDIISEQLTEGPIQPPLVQPGANVIGAGAEIIQSSPDGQQITIGDPAVPQGQKTYHWNESQQTFVPMDIPVIPLSTEVEEELTVTEPDPYTPGFSPAPGIVPVEPPTVPQPMDVPTIPTVSEEEEEVIVTEPAPAPATVTSPEPKTTMPSMFIPSERVIDRVNTFEDHITEYATKSGLDAALIKAIISTESGGIANAKSGAGARGLMQLMQPAIADAKKYYPKIVEGINMQTTLMDDPRANIAFGTAYFKYLMNRFNDDVQASLAAYNAGPTRVAKLIRKHGANYASYLPQETQDYVPRVLSYLKMISKQNPQVSRIEPGGGQEQNGEL